MYVWIWRHLPGPLPLRVLQSLVLLGVVVTALFVWVFPRVEATLPYSDVTVPGPSVSPTPTVTAPASPGTTVPTGPATLPAE